MREYIIKQGNIVKFLPRELEEQAIAVLGAKPTIRMLGDNRQRDQSAKIDCCPYASYIAIEPVTAEDVEKIINTTIQLHTG